jgi:CubicO group peptidase (beta-lactamase class C family)
VLHSCVPSVKRRSAGALFVALVVAVIPRGTPFLASTQDDLSPALQVFERYLTALGVRANIPGFSAAVVQHGRIVWEQGFGYQDLEKRVPAGPDTPYPIASLTKTFTSTLLMQCVERHTLDLDTPMQTFTTAIRETGATVRHVLSHTSAGTPGTAFRYDGDRFAALTPVVEGCTGLPFPVALTDRILEPLAMRQSVPGHDLAQKTLDHPEPFAAATLARFHAVLAHLATPYEVNAARSVVTTFPPAGINGSAGLISTVRDLARYDAALDDHFFITAETQASAWTPMQAGGRAQPYALGWFVQRYRNSTAIWHYGSWPQFSALYVKLPAQGLTLLLLANSGGLSTPFPLAEGDLTSSPFGRVFLALFAQ